MIEIKNKNLQNFLRYITYLGNLFPQFLICALLLIIDFDTGYQIGSIWFWAYALNFCIKNTVRKRRPAKENWKVPIVRGWSFPSGHSLMSLVLYWTIAKYFMISIPWSLPLLVLPFILGFSRLYLRVHFIEDVVMGWLIGYFYLHFFELRVLELQEIFYPYFYQATHWF